MNLDLSSVRASVKPGSLEVGLCTMKARLSPNLISFFLVRRGNWTLKVSVYKNKQILVFMQHVYDMDNIVMQYFHDQSKAADFIEHIIEEV